MPASAERPCARFVACVATVAFVVGGAAAQAPAVPEWTGFERILWLHGGPPRDAALFDTVRALGFTAVSVAAEEDASVPARHGLRFYRDQIAGKGVLELRDAEWLDCQKAYQEHRRRDALQRPACLASDAARAALDETTARRLAAVQAHGPIAVSLGDEISVTRRGNPLDFCFGEDCLRAFQRFAAAAHGDVDRINREWGTEFAALDQVRPLTTDEVRERALITGALPGGLAVWHDHLRFKEQQLAAAVARVAAMVDAALPGVPRGLTGMQPPAAFGGHDYRLLLPDATFYEVYDIGGARDLAMCLAPRGARQVRTLFADEWARALMPARVFDLVAHGMSGIIIWSAGDAIAPAGEPTAFGLAVRNAFAALGAAAAAAAGSELLRDPVWLVESQASVRAHWMLDSAADGGSWLRRLSSYEAEHSTSQAARHSWTKVFEDLGLQPRWVLVEQLAERLQVAPPRLVVLPALLALSDAQAAAIESYVAAGGTVLADHGTGVYDERLRPRRQGVLDEVFGLHERSARLADLSVRGGRADAARLASGVGVAEPRLRGALGEPHGENHVHFEHRHGDGRAVYFNLAVCEYGRLRLDPDAVAAARDLRARVRRVTRDAGVRPPVEVVGDGLPTLIERTRLRTADGRMLVAVRINALDEPAQMAAIVARGPRPVRLHFPEPVDATDLVSGEELRGRVLATRLPPLTGLLLEIR